VKENSFNYLGKLYVWSIIFEPLLFFIVVGQDVSGVGGNIGRLLQMVVILLLILTTLVGKEPSLKVPNPFYYHFRWYSAYLFASILAALYGIFSGAYEISSGITGEGAPGGVYFTGEGAVSSEDASILFRILDSTWIRPLFEYFIAIYFFIYFVVLPQYLLNSRKAINYFFKVFFGMFFLSFFVGLIDFLLVITINYEWIPRHLSDFKHVGLRFHGLAGEPRDAFVYLIFGICLIFLKEKWTGSFKGKRFWFVTIFLAALATQSASGFIGLFLAIILMVIYLLPKLPMQSFLTMFATLFMISILAVSAIMNSPRVLRYIEYVPIAIEAFQSGIDLPPIVETQRNNIYPIWIRWQNLMEANLLPLFIGTGLGTASIANGHFIAEGGTLNPHANFIRIAFEGGVMGLLLYIAAFLKPLKFLKPSKQDFHQLMLFMLLILGSSFGHRSSTLYIFFGLVLLVFNYKRSNLEVKKI